MIFVLSILNVSRFFHCICKNVRIINLLTVFLTVSYNNNNFLTVCKNNKLKNRNDILPAPELSIAKMQSEKEVVLVSIHKLFQSWSQFTSVV